LFPLGAGRKFEAGNRIGIYFGVIYSVSDTPRILLIDDSDLILKALNIYLSERFEVVSAVHPLDALNEFGTHSFDLIITDLLMPAASGFGLIAALRQIYPQTPIIAMTGWGKPPNWEGLGADTLLMKPFELEELDRNINSLLMNRTL
jgi:DNA-binding response OmpR family regulator